MPDRYAGKAVVVTGGGSGIARALCQKLAAEGALVLVADIAPEGGAETVRLVSEQGGTASYVQGDVTVAADAERIVGACIESFGRLDALFNIAGASRPGDSVVGLAEDDWHFVIDGNLASVFLMSKYAIPHIAGAGGGAIVNVASGSGVFGQERNPAYVAAKGGVIALTKALAIDHAPDKIRVNCVAPGPVMTPLMERNRSPREITEIGNLNLLRRIGMPQDVAATIAYLGSDEASFVTGQTINVDGGVGQPLAPRTL